MLFSDGLVSFVHATCILGVLVRWLGAPGVLEGLENTLLYSLLCLAITCVCVSSMDVYWWHEEIASTDRPSVCMADRGESLPFQTLKTVWCCSQLC